MGDSPCLIHGFSYASAVPNEAKQGTSMHALGESISFGRYMIQSLSWERLSTFSSSHKKYVEEPERYAQPGSVAEKKAFFEAHYRRIAAQRAAALLEQENAAKESDENGCCEQRDDFNDPADLEFKNGDAKIQKLNDDLVDSDSHTSVVSLDGREQNDCVEDQEEDSNKGNPLSEIQAKRIPLTELDRTENLDGAKELERHLVKHAHKQMPRAPTKKKTTLLSLKPPIQGKQSKVLYIPVKPVARKPQKENSPCEILRKSARSYDKSLWSVKDKDIPSIKTNCSGKRISLTQTSSKESEVDATPLRTAKVGVSEAVFSAPVATPLLENKRMGKTDASGNKTSGPKWHIPYADRSSVKSLWSVKELDKDKVSINKQNQSRTHATPMKNAKVGASKTVFASPAAAHHLQNTRMVTPGNFSASGSKSCRPKWRLISAVSKSYTGCHKRMRNTILSTPFVLRTEERAAMRKQKLEEKFSASKTQKKSASSKNSDGEKAGKEFQKLSHGLCFKNLPNFHKETQTSKMKKDKTTHGGIASMPRPATTLGAKRWKF